MPVIDPLVSAVNFTPSSAEELSPESTSADEGAEKSKIVSSGVTAGLADDAGPDPIPFVAVTVKVYDVPLLSPVTTAEVADGLPTTTGDPAAVPPAYGVIVYELIGLPFALGGDHDTIASLDAGEAITLVGAEGTDGPLEADGWNRTSTQ
jgi:hypothetical protein